MSRSLGLGIAGGLVLLTAVGWLLLAFAGRAGPTAYPGGSSPGIAPITIRGRSEWPEGPVVRYGRASTQPAARQDVHGRDGRAAHPRRRCRAGIRQQTELLALSL